MILFYDTECYPNKWMLKLRPRIGPAITFRLGEGESLNRQQIMMIDMLFAGNTTVSFNGNSYDRWMISAAREGYTTESLKQLNDMIIVQGVKPWETGVPDWAPADHIDVMEVAPGQASLKQYAARINAKTIRDLPYDPGTHLTEEQWDQVDSYCENDLNMLMDLFDALQPQLKLREALSRRYGMDLRSKSDAQLAEAVLRKQCEQALGRRVYKPNVDWNMRFRYEPPAFIGFNAPHLQQAFRAICSAEFRLGASGAVEMPAALEDMDIHIGLSTYKIGIGGLHSQEKRAVHVSDQDWVLRDNDVASYYPSLILNSGECPPALGEAFRAEYQRIKDERLDAKARQKKLTKGTPEWVEASTLNEGGKIMINGTFGKLGSPYSVLFAPEMLIQTTVTGQLSLLMLIEWHEHHGIPVVSANTDGVVIKCPRDKVALSEWLIGEWQKRTGLEMETVEYRAIYSRDVNNYFAIKTDGEVKRKGEYSKSGLMEKKNPDCEVCSDAVAAYLANGTPLIQSLLECRDLRKFLVVQRVSGGGVKMWGEGPKKGELVRDMVPRLSAHGWVKKGRLWSKGEHVNLDAHTAYSMTFAPQRPEYLGKVIRWYYGANSPGPIVYQSNGNTVSLSYGAHPVMTLPDEFPQDIDYAWYFDKCVNILRDIGVTP